MPGWKSADYWATSDPIEQSSGRVIPTYPIGKWTRRKETKKICQRCFDSLTGREDSTSWYWSGLLPFPKMSIEYCIGKSDPSPGVTEGVRLTSGNPTCALFTDICLNNLSTKSEGCHPLLRDWKRERKREESFPAKKILTTSPARPSIYVESPLSRAFNIWLCMDYCLVMVDKLVSWWEILLLEL